MPAVALSDLAIERKAIADGEVEAQIRMTVYTAAPGTNGLAKALAPAAIRGSGTGRSRRGDRGLGPRGNARARGRALRATLVGRAAEDGGLASSAAGPRAAAAPPHGAAAPLQLPRQPCPRGDPPVFFLAHGDRTFDAHIGDRLDGVYQLESAAKGELVFVYLSLNIRQNLSAGASK